MAHTEPSAQAGPSSLPVSAPRSVAAPLPGSSSARAHAALRSSMRRLLSTQPLARTSERALDVLTEVAARYIALLASTAAARGQHSGRTRPAFWDVAAAIDDLGSDVEELADWVQDGAGLSASEAHRDPALAELNAHGRRPVAAARQELHYVSVPNAALADLKQLQLLEDDPWTAQAAETDDEEQALTPTRSRSSSSGSSSSGKRRRVGKQPDYVPSFLPHFPDARYFTTHSTASDPSNGWAVEVLHDGEYRSAKAEESHQPQNGDLDRGATSPPDEKAELHPQTNGTAQLPDLGDPPDGASDAWRRRVPYDASTLATQQGISDLPSIEGLLADTEPRPRTSSLRAFAADYRALVAEQAPPALLTPTGGAHAGAAATRRMLALALADPGRFVPSDSVFAAVAARPAALPFTPSASHFVTSTGLFTATRPGGRPAALIAPSGALAPALAHRWPAHTMTAARTVSGAGLLKRVSRSADPPPVFDDSGVERVFQGGPAPSDLLAARHSVLAPALRTIVAQTAAGDDEAPAEKPREGMLVHTWDWTTRDYSDSSLPGRRVPARGPGDGEQATSTLTPRA